MATVEIPDLKSIMKDFKSRVSNNDKDNNSKGKSSPCYVIESVYLQPISGNLYTYIVVMSERNAGIVGVYAGNDFINIIKKPNGYFWQDVAVHYINLAQVVPNSQRYSIE